MCDCYSNLVKYNDVSNQTFGYFRYQGPDGEYRNYFFHESKNDCHLIVNDVFSDDKTNRIMKSGKKVIDNSEKFVASIRKFVVDNKLVEFARKQNTLCGFAHLPEGCKKPSCQFNHDMSKFVCPFEDTFGQCTRQDCVYQHELPKNDKLKVASILCKFAYKGGCKNQKCPYNHDMSQFACPFEDNYGQCTRENCQYQHTSTNNEVVDNTINGVVTVVADHLKHLYSK